MSESFADLLEESLKKTQMSPWRHVDWYGY